MMLQKHSDAVLLVSRILLSFIFITAGWSKIGGFAGVSAWVGSVLPFPELITVLVIVIELVGGLMLLVGLKTKYAALAIGLFSLLAAFLFHLDFADQVQSGMFMKNLAIAGGMFYVTVFGAGKFSVDAKMGKKSAPATASM